MKIRLAAMLQNNSIVDGEGIRAIIWTQGCIHNCPGCHNPTTHDLNAGFLVDIEELEKEIDSLDIEDGITFSGGEPFLQPKECCELAKFIKRKGLNIWCYTGFLFEDILKDPEKNEFLKYIDVLVDGPFIKSQRSLNLVFRGSSNQRIIDVQESIKQKQVVLVKKYEGSNNIKPLYEKENNIYI